LFVIFWINFYTITMLLYNQITSLNSKKLKKIMSQFLKEDIPKGDPTTQNIISLNQRGEYVFRARDNMIFCGGPIIQNTFSKQVVVKLLVKEGQYIKKGDDLGTIKGNVREILTKERLVLNMIQRLSGISSNTQRYISKLNNSKIKILDTRKTTPGLRLLEKYAVNKGGGYNHRLDLSSGIMVKDNHLINSNIDNIYKKLKKLKKKIPIQIEIDNINQITQRSVDLVDAFLLDNMSPAKIKQCIIKIKKLKKTLNKIFIEVSGGVTLKTISKFNIKGVSGISIGALTHQSQSVDISLDIK
jgi:nicotinate-nucleotide pyrophosphorylase (carboxylating)